MASPAFTFTSPHQHISRKRVTPYHVACRARRLCHKTLLPQRRPYPLLRSHISEATPPPPRTYTDASTAPRFTRSQSDVVIGHAGKYWYRGAQTERIGPPRDVANLAVRETQTKELRNRGVVTKSHACSQTHNPRIVLATRGQKHLTPRKTFITGELKLEIDLLSIIKIQCWFRTIISRRKTNQLRRERCALIKRLSAEYEQERLRLQRIIHREYCRRIQPQSAKHLEAMRETIENWKRRMFHNSGWSESELLQRYARLLQRLDRAEYMVVMRERRRQTQRTRHLQQRAKSRYVAKGKIEVVDLKTSENRQLLATWEALMTENNVDPLDRYVKKHMDDCASAARWLKDCVALVTRWKRLEASGLADSWKASLKQRISSSLWYGLHEHIFDGSKPGRPIVQSLDSDLQLLMLRSHEVDSATDSPTECPLMNLTPSQYRVLICDIHQGDPATRDSVLLRFDPNSLLFPWNVFLSTVSTASEDTSIFTLSQDDTDPSLCGVNHIARVHRAKLVALRNLAAKEMLTMIKELETAILKNWQLRMKGILVPKGH